MRFSCDRCGKRYATKDVPLPGRIYRLKCRACGNLVVVKGDDFLASTPPRTDPAPAASEPSAVTPLSDLAVPAAPPPPTTAFEPPAAPPAPEEAPAATTGAVPPPVPAAASAPQPKYIELFDERDFADERAAPTPPPPVAPDPFAVPERTPAGVEPARRRPMVSPDELREAAESLPQTLVDPFAHSGEFEPAPVAQDVSPSRPSHPAPTPGPARAVSVHEIHPRPSSHRPAPRARRVGAAVWIGSMALVVAAAGAGFVVFRPTQRATPPASAAAAHFPSAPAPASPAPTADGREHVPAGDKVAVQPTGENPAPPPQPAAAPASAAAAEPAAPAAPLPEPAPQPAGDASPPARVAAKASPPPRTAPARTEKPARPARPARSERMERKVATSERRETPDAPTAAAPPPAAASPGAEPEADEPTGLSQDQIRRALAGGRKGFDACLKDPWRGLDQPVGPRQITLRFTVSPEGTVGYATIDDVTISGAPVGQCLKAAARGLTFPSFQGDPVKVDAPITIPAK